MAAATYTTSTDDNGNKVVTIGNYVVGGKNYPVVTFVLNMYLGDGYWANAKYSDYYDAKLSFNRAVEDVWAGRVGFVEFLERNELGQESLIDSYSICEALVPVATVVASS